MKADQLLDSAAEVLEKTAAYLEKQEAHRVSADHEAKTAVARDLAAKLSETVGEQFDESMVEKLSEVSPEIQSLLGRVTGTDLVDSLGGVDEDSTTKTASINGAMGPAEASFMEFLQSS